MDTRGYPGRYAGVPGISHLMLPGESSPLERPWWGLLMTEDAYTQLVREIEIERSRMNVHEAVCAERYKGLVGALDELKSGVGAIRVAVASQPQRLSRWVISALIGVMGCMVGLIGWEAKQLYDLEPTRSVAHMVGADNLLQNQQ